MTQPTKDQIGFQAGFLVDFLTTQRAAMSNLRPEDVIQYALIQMRLLWLEKNVPTWNRESVEEMWELVKRMMES